MSEEVWADIPIELTDTSLKINNGEELIVLALIDQEKYKKVIMPVFGSYFELKKDLKSGYWFDPSRGESYRIPVELIFLDPDKSSTLDGKWALNFAQGEDAYQGVLKLESMGDRLLGTILTETGDYRYLHGELKNDSLRLQTFDGSHLFLFTAKLKGEDLTNGIFYSGDHYVENWEGSKNSDMTLRKSNEILKSNGAQIFFEALNEEGEMIRIDSNYFKARLTIIQIMGTWCPNCMDETRVLQDLYEKYGDQGLDVLAIAFERYAEPEKAWRSISRACKDLSIDYRVLYGGKADKALAAEKFPFLDELYSFPTTVFVNQNAQVIAVHSGFNGPATGEEYQIELRLLNDVIKGQLY